MMNAGSDLVDIIKSQANIVDVISKVVKLRQNSRTWQGLCPFHSEKTPSFHVYAEKKQFHCFGCHMHGDVITFVERYYDITFKEALSQLAQELGIDITRFYKNGGNPHKEIIEILTEATDLFHQNLLNSPENSAQIRFLIDRNLASKKLLKFFKVGWSANDLPSQLYDKYSTDKLIEAGLLYEYQHVYKPRFFNRIVFPILLGAHHTVGFGGRRLDFNQSSKAPKYLNSPETSVFKKNQILYGAEKITYKQQCPWVLVVEGYIDVIQLRRFAFPAVAPMGTAFTAAQYQKLLELRKELIFCFDGDQAGVKASQSALQLILPMFQAQHNISFVILPQGEDPDSILTTKGKEYFASLCKARKKFVEFFFESVQKEFPASGPDSQMKFNAKVRSLIRSVEDPDARRGLESSLFQYEKDKYFKGKKAKVVPKLQLPQPLSNLEMLRLLLLNNINLITNLSEKDKKLLNFSNDTTVCRLLYGNIEQDCVSKLRREFTHLHSNTLSLISKNDIEKEFSYQLEKFNKSLLCLLLVNAPTLKNTLAHDVKEKLLQLGDYDISEVLSLSPGSERFTRVKKRIQSHCGAKLDLSTQEKSIRLVNELVDNLIK